MTICIAAICQFSFVKEDGSTEFSPAVVTASDRMYTDEGLGIEYESPQGKYAILGNRVIILASDSIAVHSDLITDLRRDIDENKATPKEVADHYAKLIVDQRQKNAERLYLSRYGLTMADFVEQSKDNNSFLFNGLSQSIMDYDEKVEAIVAGVIPRDGLARERASIYSVDRQGVVTTHTDMGYASIGSGHPHANAHLMKHKYWNQWNWFGALTAVFVAKKQAQVAPGVGDETDMFLITRDGIERVLDHTMQTLADEYPGFRDSVRSLEEDMAQRIWAKAIAVAQPTAAEPPSDQLESDASSSIPQT